MALTRRQLSDPDCPVSDDDFDAIEAAIMETARGRWFLSEYARRHRHADTLMLLTAINSLGESLKDQAATLPSRRGPYLVDTRLSAALTLAPPANGANGSAAAAPPDGGPLPGDDMFKFKL